jgi:hypothetical protein
VSLRRDIHVAIDEVAPPVPALPGLVTRFVFADKETRRELVRARRGVRLHLFRGAFSMVAAALIVVLIAAVVVGPRVWRAWDASVGHPRTIQSELQKLEARPLQLQSIAAGEVCPEGPFTQPPPSAHLGPVRLYGGGPVYIAEISGRDAQSLQTGWGTYLYVAWTVPYGHSGLVLIRARDLQTNQPAVFARDATAPDKIEVAAGQLVGEDVVSGHRVQQFNELALDTSRLRGNLPGWWAYDKYTIQGFPKGGSLCIGYQVDGPGFTETFVANYG